MAFVGGVDADCCIGHDCLGAGCGNDKVFVGGLACSVGDIVFQMIEMALGVFMDDFVVAHGCEGFRVPVDHPYAFVNPTFLVEIDEGIDDGFAEGGFHRKACAVPVAGGAELTELLEDDATVLFLPGPGVLKELFAGEVFLADSLVTELGHDFVLGGNRGVVGSGHPAGVLAVHPGLADEYVVKCIVQDVPHMEDAGYVGRGYHDGIGFPCIGLGMEEFILQPVRIPFVLHRGGIVFHVEFHKSLSFTQILSIELQN